MTSPSEPDVKGTSGDVLHDGMNDAGHREQADKGGSDESVNKEDRHEGGGSED